MFCTLISRGFLITEYFSEILTSYGIWPHGTSWVNEAAAETYIPLLQELYRLVDDGYNNLKNFDWQITAKKTLEKLID